jgi:hypothetical protein
VCRVNIALAQTGKIQNIIYIKIKSDLSTSSETVRRIELQFGADINIILYIFRNSAYLNKYKDK